MSDARPSRNERGLQAILLGSELNVGAAVGAVPFGLTNAAINAARVGHFARIVARDTSSPSLRIEAQEEFERCRDLVWDCATLNDAFIQGQKGLRHVSLPEPFRYLVGQTDSILGISPRYQETFRIIRNDAEQGGRLFAGKASAFTEPAGGIRFAPVPEDPADVLRTARDGFAPLAGAYDFLGRVSTTAATTPELRKELLRCAMQSIDFDSYLEHVDIGGTAGMDPQERRRYQLPASTNAHEALKTTLAAAAAAYRVSHYRGAKEIGRALLTNFGDWNPDYRRDASRVGFALWQVVANPQNSEALRHPLRADQLDELAAQLYELSAGYGVRLRSPRSPRSVDKPRFGSESAFETATERLRETGFNGDPTSTRWSRSFDADGTRRQTL
jgi:hypothetical protein